MKSATLLAKRLLPLLVLLLGFSIRGAAQAWNLPHCSGNGAGKIYYLGASNEIQILDPANPTFPRQTGIFAPPGAKALAIGLNPNGGPSPTYYTIGPIGGNPRLQYFDGSTFVDAGVTMNVDHLAGSCGNIYGLDCSSGFIFRWITSVSTAPNPLTYVTTVPTGLVCDISGDCNGGFWAVYTGGATPSVRHYNTATPPVNDSTFTMTGTFTTGNEGVAVIGNRVYYDGTDNKLYTGIRNAATMTVNFTASTATPFAIIANQDFASCGLEGGCSGKGARDTIYACTSNTDAVVTLKATGPGPYAWTVQDGGPAVLTTSGNSVTVTTHDNTTITYKSANCAGTNAITDTTVILINNALIDAGKDDTVIGCQGKFIDTLRGTIRDTTIGLSWAYDWTPLTGMLQGNTTLDSAIIAPTTCTKYFLTVSTNTGCTWKDSVLICVADSTPRPHFTYFKYFGCERDTVRFINTTPTNPYSSYVHWNFGDTTESYDVSPTHIYKEQGIFTVTLTMSNRWCADSFKAAVNTLHKLKAEFKPSDTATCANLLLRFTDASQFWRDPANPVDPTYLYDFGDGTTSTLSSPTKTYPVPGRYLVKMWIHDALGCVDSYQRLIVVDTIPFASFRTADTSICEGQAVNLFADYSSIGNRSTTFDMGDGTTFNDLDTVRYSYSDSGNYVVTFTARYRICPDAIFSRNIRVNPFPGVYIGEDTVLCPNGAPIALSDRININNPAAKYLWNTGDSTASILARDIGVYWARVTIGGCSGTDSLTVNKDCYIDIPNIFSPNGDNVNDYFYPKQFLSRGVTSFKMSIFNRWGQVIFESTSLDGRGWDGRFNDKPQPQGVYVYIIDVSFGNGVKEHYTGNVTLIR